MNEELKIVIRADTQEFMKNVQSVQKEVKNTGKVLEDASSDVVDFAGEFDGLSKELKDAKAEFVNMAKQFGENSKEAQEAAKKIEDLSTKHMEAKTELEKLQSVADAFDNGLKAMKQAEQEAAEEAKRLAEETERAAQEMKDAEERSKALEDELKNIKETGAKAMKGLATAVAGALASVIALSEATRELRNNQQLVQTAFESAGRSAETATQVYNDLYRVLGDDGKATEASVHLAKLAANQEELSEWTDICMGVYSQFGDSLPIEGLTEAVNHTAQLGEVQGTLADALEWSGTSVESFNAELAQCTTESEREELIRSKLNGLYKQSADNYKKNNGEILDANDAQREMNESLSKLGKIMEPVNTDLKKMGASLLNDLADPLSDIAGFLSKTLFPVIKTVYNFVKSSMPYVKGLVAALTVAYTAYRIAAYQAKLEEQKLTIAMVASAAATKAKTAAQHALNIAMKATPWGLVASLVVGVGTTLWSLFGAEEEVTDQTQQMTAATTDFGVSTQEAKDFSTEFTTQLHEQAKALEEQKAKIDESNLATQAMSEHNTNLVDELFLLVDANGKVQEGYEGRVGFILNELNSAYETEFQMVDGVIQEYATLRDTVYEVIEAKTAQAMMEAHNEAYIEAITNENAALSDMTQAYQDVEEQQRIVAQTEEELTAMKQTLRDQRHTMTDDEIRDLSREIFEKQNRLYEEQGFLREKEKAYQEAAGVYKTYQDDIAKYMEAGALIAEGKHQEAIDLLKAESAAYFDYSDDVDQATQEAIDALWKQAVDAGIKAEETKKNFENGVEGYTEEMVKEAETAYEDTLNTWASAYSDASGFGGDLGDGVFDGLGGRIPSLVQQGKNVVNSIIGAMKNAADSHSPSKKTMALGMDMGEGTEIGLENTTKDVVKASQNMIGDSIKAMKGLSATNFKDMISTSFVQTILPQKPRGIEGQAIELLSCISERMSGNTPIILQVDGKTFAQTCISTINQNTRQTGQLNLNII